MVLEAAGTGRLEARTVTLRELPSVDRLLQEADALVSSFGRSLTVQALRATLDNARLAIREGGAAPDEGVLLAESKLTLQSWLAPTLRNVINATGVIVHTNLGRAPLSAAARAAMEAVGAGYSTLEYDLVAGARGERSRHAEELLIRLSGAEAALVVNNNAAAILLALTALAHEREVLVSRTQLIEIGGGFRIPEILSQSGARLHEVGTTNRTHLKDFEQGISDRTALIMRAHHSNFKIVGFATEPTLQELVSLGAEHELPMLDDLGSGAVLDTAEYGLGHEPMVQESVLTGATVTAFSGDKLLGGPQAGILVGERSVIDQLRIHPMARAVRPDKTCLAGLSATLLHYIKEEAESEIPVWKMISQSEAQLSARAEAWSNHLEQGQLVAGRSTVGGGSLPEETLPTWLLALEVERPNAFAGRLREADRPIIARVEDDRVVLDPRTVSEEHEDSLLTAVAATLNGWPNQGTYS
jgi:L-seryl-tRNA(Ser) seleniumtransferase